MGKCQSARRKRKSKQAEDQLYPNRKPAMPPFKDEHILVSGGFGLETTAFT